MGHIFGSSEESSESKTIDTNGNVNNNIVLLQQEARDTHDQMVLNQKMFIASCLLVLFEVVKLTVYVISSYKKKIKKAIGGNKI